MNTNSRALSGADNTTIPIIKHGKAKTKPAGSTQTNLWIGPESQRALAEAAEAIARITGVKESVAVLLRAGITALNNEIKLVEAEHRKSSEIGRREWRLRHAVAQANFASR
jgi:hypothetical protein